VAVKLPVPAGYQAYKKIGWYESLNTPAGLYIIGTSPYTLECQFYDLLKGPTAYMPCSTNAAGKIELNRTYQYSYAGMERGGSMVLNVRYADKLGNKSLPASFSYQIIPSLNYATHCESNPIRNFSDADIFKYAQTRVPASGSFGSYTRLDNPRIALQTSAPGNPVLQFQSARRTFILSPYHDFLMVKRDYASSTHPGVCTNRVKVGFRTHEDYCDAIVMNAFGTGVCIKSVIATGGVQKLASFPLLHVFKKMGSRHHKFFGPK
jgi:hypothetical protein